MIFPLVQDFADALAAMLREHPRYRILKLLDEAIRCDVHFIDRHPTTFFQCMWNACWWYDSPEAAGHYQRPNDEVGPAPRESPVARQLASLVETWRARKERATPGFAWLRSLRPPAVPLGTGQRLVLQGHTDAVRAVCYLPDGRRLASASEDATLRVWDTASGADILRLVGHSAWVMDVCCSPDGRWLASASADRTARVWDAATGVERLRLVGHSDYLTAACFSPDGKRLATGSRDKTVRLWDTANGGELLRLEGHQDHVSAVCFSPDGTQLASASFDGAVRLWHPGAATSCTGWTGMRGQCMVSASLPAAGGLRAPVSKRWSSGTPRPGPRQADSAAAREGWAQLIFRPTAVGSPRPRTMPSAFVTRRPARSTCACPAILMASATFALRPTAGS